MNTLGIDTTTDICSVALKTAHGQKSLTEHSPKQHTQKLLPMIDSLLSELSLTLHDLDLLAFGRGPGSFTGLRIASSLIQGLSFGLNLPVVPVSSLQAMAQGCYRLHGATDVYARLDARMNQYYWGLFKLADDKILQPVSEECVQSLDTIILPAGHWVLYTDAPNAIDIIAIAEHQFKLGHVGSALDAQPVYIRNNYTDKKQE